MGITLASAVDYVLDSEAKVQEASGMHAAPLDVDRLCEIMEAMLAEGLVA